ncbi:UPF0158 family protein [Legionella dresdenensis]|uniref:UPF0158 family protein n=1 Tax=Legionella dresdenensis TaxID=450200 RepID=A0ABV8CFI0_9GAMM
MNKVKLSDIINALEFQFDESSSFIDKRTNEVCVISDEELSYAEDGNDDYPGWMEENIAIAKAYLEDDSNFIALPLQEEVNEYRIMENFANSITDKHNQDKLFIALSGKGAFRRFKDTVNFLGIADGWYKYRDDQYKKFALEWCEMNGIEVSDN